MENPSRVALLKHFKWKKVALIVQNLDIYVLVRSLRYINYLNCIQSLERTDSVEEELIQLNSYLLPRSCYRGSKEKLLNMKQIHLV